MAIKDIKKIKYTDEDELEYLEDGDKTIELNVYVHEIYAVKIIKMDSLTKRLFKFLASNRKQKLYILIWNDLIEDFEPEIHINRILHIIGGHCRNSHHNNSKDKTLLRYEIVIQPFTVVKFLGYHEAAEKMITAIMPLDVNIDTIKDAVGVIRIKGHIKQPFLSVNNATGTVTYGSGSIAVSEHRIPVEIAKYSSTKIDVTAGTCVIVTGTIIDNEGPFKIRCTDISGIEIQNEPVKEKDELQKAYRTIKRKM